MAIGWNLVCDSVDTTRDDEWGFTIEIPERAQSHAMVIKKRSLRVQM